MDASEDIDRRNLLKGAGLLAAGARFRPRAFLQELAAPGPKPSTAKATTIGRREMIRGLDGMSRVADRGNDPFAHGHGAAAVIASAFFCHENNLDAGTQETILSLMEARILFSPIFAPRPEEPADPELVAGLVQDLDDGIRSLRRSGHNIIFAALALKALREVPEAATPARVQGLRRMVRSFGTEKTAGIPAKGEDLFADPAAGKRFIASLFEEYLHALDLYLNGQGHHGFAGHVLTVGHALVELVRLGYPETARSGLGAFRLFIRQAREGADLGGQRVRGPPPRFARPLDKDYWVEQVHRPAGGIVSSHLIKYPYSFYALLKDLDDEELKQRVLRTLYHLTAVS